MGDQLRAAADRFEKRKRDPIEADLLIASVRVIAAGADAIDEILAKPPLLVRRRRRLSV